MRELQLSPLYFEGGDAKSGVLCTLCPHACRFRHDGVGRCGVRGVMDGIPHLPYAGRVAAQAVDPIEKKPLYHYYPGSMVYSVGFWGCNLQCPFCQNYRISRVNDSGKPVGRTHASTGRTHSTADELHIMQPRELIQAALDAGSFAVAYTYNEPAIHIEYLIESCRLAHKAGLKNILVTAGFLNETAARDLLHHIDAANVDLKAFNEENYRALGGGLEPVLAFLRVAAELTHLEVTTLLIPGFNDTPTEMQDLSSFIAHELGTSTPLHISAYHPVHGSGFAAPPTKPEAVLSAVESAARHLSYVYPGNITAPAHTVCPSCGRQVLRRHGYQLSLVGIDETGNCSFCGQKICVRS